MFLITNFIFIFQEDDDVDPLDAFMADVSKEVTIRCGKVKSYYYTHWTSSGPLSAVWFINRVDIQRYC